MNIVKALFFKSNQEWYVVPLNSLGSIINQHQIHYDEESKQYRYQNQYIQWLGTQAPKANGMALMSNRHSYPQKTKAINLDESPMIIELTEENIKWNDSEKNTVHIQIKGQEYHARFF